MISSIAKQNDSQFGKFAHNNNFYKFPNLDMYTSDNKIGPIYISYDNGSIDREGINTYYPSRLSFAESIIHQPICTHKQVMIYSRYPENKLGRGALL